MKRSPIGRFPFYLLLETSGSNLEHDEQKVSHFLEAGLSNGVIKDAFATNETSKVNHIWSIREKIPTARMNEKYHYNYDISLPLSRFYEIVPVLQKHLDGLVDSVTGFGHIGDSNLHVNIQCDEYDEKVHKQIEPFIYEYTAKLRGSISAEHGIGLAKKGYLKTFKQTEALNLMKEIKMVMDPKRILNPYKIVD